MLKMKDCTGQLSHTKKPKTPQKITKVDDCRIFSLVKRNKFISLSNQVKNTPGFHCQALQSINGLLNGNTEALEQGALC